MSRRSLIIWGAVVVAAALAWLFWPTDEARIKKLFKEGTAAIEAEKLEEVMAKVSLTYADDYGLNYLLLKNGMQRVFAQMDHIKIEYEINKITVRDTQADAELDVRIVATTGPNTGYIVGDLKAPAHMNFRLEKERGRWLVSRTDGTRVMMLGQ